MTDTPKNPSESNGDINATEIFERVVDRLRRPPNEQAMGAANQIADLYDKVFKLPRSQDTRDRLAEIIHQHMCSAGDAALLAEAANMLEQVIEAAEIAMKDVNAESSSDVWDVNHLLGPARGVLARCRAAHATESIPAAVEAESQKGNNS